jgi:hypothetical protein
MFPIDQSKLFGAGKSFTLKEAEVITQCILSNYSRGDFDNYVENFVDLRYGPVVGDEMNLVMTKEEWRVFLRKFDNQDVINGMPKHWMEAVNTHEVVTNYIIDLLKQSGWHFDHGRNNYKESIMVKYPKMSWKEVKLMSHHFFLMLISSGSGEESYDAFVANPLTAQGALRGEWLGFTQEEYNKCMETYDGLMQEFLGDDHLQEAIANEVVRIVCNTDPEFKLSEQWMTDCITDTVVTSANYNQVDWYLVYEMCDPDYSEGAWDMLMTPTVAAACRVMGESLYDFIERLVHDTVNEQ